MAFTVDIVFSHYILLMMGVSFISSQVALNDLGEGILKLLDVAASPPYRGVLFLSPYPLSSPLFSLGSVNELFCVDDSAVALQRAGAANTKGQPLDIWIVVLTYDPQDAEYLSIATASSFLPAHHRKRSDD